MKSKLILILIGASFISTVFSQSSVSDSKQIYIRNHVHSIVEDGFYSAGIEISDFSILSEDIGSENPSIFSVVVENKKGKEQLSVVIDYNYEDQSVDQIAVHASGAIPLKNKELSPNQILEREESRINKVLEETSDLVDMKVEKIGSENFTWSQEGFRFQADVDVVNTKNGKSIEMELLNSLSENYYADVGFSIDLNDVTGYSENERIHSINQQAIDKVLHKGNLSAIIGVVDVSDLTDGKLMLDYAEVEGVPHHNAVKVRWHENHDGSTQISGEEFYGDYETIHLSHHTIHSN